MRARFAEVADAAQREQLTYRGFLAELLMAECDDRDRRRSARRITAAGFPREKWLQDFDYAANPHIQPAVIAQLASCVWVSKGEPLCLIGDSGTGKTMSAEVIAGELGLDLYRVDLATVVDKYVGETEKNLEKIFTEAAGVNGVLLFDEADAVFGKRSEVRDAHDRYANIESAYLLQRLESFDGLAVLATNLRANIDDAFTRRLDSIIDFPTPTDELRLQLWRNCLAPPLPVASDGSALVPQPTVKSPAQAMIRSASGSMARRYQGAASAASYPG